MPLGHAYPLLSGCSLSGRSLVTTPSSTVATIPQCASQIRQNVTTSAMEASLPPAARPFHPFGQPVFLFELGEVGGERDGCRRPQDVRDVGPGRVEQLV